MTDEPSDKPISKRARDIERIRQWRINNPEAAREKARIAYQKRKDDGRQKGDSQRTKEWREKNPEKYKALNQKRNPNHKEIYKLWVKNNPDKVKAILTRYKNKPESIKKRKLSSKLWAKKNKEARNSITRNRRAKLKQIEGTHTKEDILFLHNKQKARCAECKSCIKTKYHVDHVIPVFLGGSNSKRNLQLLCQKCNLEKSCKHPIDFAKQKGRLL